MRQKFWVGFRSVNARWCQPLAFEKCSVKLCTHVGVREGWRSQKTFFFRFAEPLRYTTKHLSWPPRATNVTAPFGAARCDTNDDDDVNN